MSAGTDGEAGLPLAGRLRHLGLLRLLIVREWRPGLMHAAIFLGFMSLLLRKLQLPPRPPPCIFRVNVLRPRLSTRAR